MFAQLYAVFMFAVSLVTGSGTEIKSSAGDVLMTQDRDQVRLVEPIQLHDQVQDQDKDQIHLNDVVLLADQIQLNDQIQDKAQDQLQLQDCDLDCDPIQDRIQDKDQLLLQDCDQDCDPIQDRLQDKGQGKDKVQDQVRLKDCTP